jgi:hypothetical protein
VHFEFRVTATSKVCNRATISHFCEKKIRVRGFRIHLMFSPQKSVEIKAGSESLFLTQCFNVWQVFTHRNSRVVHQREDLSDLGLFPAQAEPVILRTVGKCQHY